MYLSLDCSASGEEQQDLIASLLHRLDGQDHKLQTQSRLLQTQDERLQAQSETLEAQQLLIQDYARDTQKLKYLLLRQGAQKKTHVSVDMSKRPHGVTNPFHDQVQDVDGLEHKTSTNGAVNSTQTEKTQNKTKLDKARKGISSRTALQNSGNTLQKYNMSKPRAIDIHVHYFSSFDNCFVVDRTKKRKLIL